MRGEVTRVRAEADAADEAAAAAAQSASSAAGAAADVAEVERLRGELMQAQAATHAAEKQVGVLKGSLAAMGKAQIELKGQIGDSADADKETLTALEQQVRALESQVTGNELALRSARGRMPSNSEARRRLWRRSLRRRGRRVRRQRPSSSVTTRWSARRR